MSSSSEAKNLEAISKAIDKHDSECEYPALAILMNPFEVERLGWDDIRGLPIRPDAKIGTGRFEILCSGDEQPGLEEEESTDAVSDTEVPTEVPTAPLVPSTH